MRWILFLFFFSIILACLGLWYLQDPGKITVTWLHYEIQCSIVTGFILLFFFTFLFLRIVYYVRAIFSYGRSLFQRSKHGKEKCELVL